MSDKEIHIDAVYGKVSGRACLAGTRLTLSTLIGYVDAGYSPYSIKDHYPSATPEHVEMVRLILEEVDEARGEVYEPDCRDYP